MADLLDMLQMEDLSGNDFDLADTVGLEAFKNLVRTYGGINGLYVPKADRLVIPIRDTLIRREYDGTNTHALAVKWGLTERYILEIAKDKAKQIRIEKLTPPKEQLRLF